MTAPKCEGSGPCPNDANAIFSDSSRGLYTPLCAAHIELEKQAYELRMDQYAIVGLPSEEPERAPASVMLPDAVDHTAPPSSLVGEHQALKDKHAEALEALNHQEALIGKLQKDLDAARAEAREHQKQHAIVVSQVAARDAEIKRLRDAAAKPAPAPDTKPDKPSKKQSGA